MHNWTLLRISDLSLPQFICTECGAFNNHPIHTEVKVIPIGRADRQYWAIIKDSGYAIWLSCEEVLLDRILNA